MNKSISIPIYCYLLVMSVYAVYGFAKEHPLYLILQEYRYPVYFFGTYLAALYLFNTRLAPRLFLKVTIVSGVVAAVAVILKVLTAGQATTYAEVRPFELPKNIIIDMVLILLSFNLTGGQIGNRWLTYLLVPMGLSALVVSFTRKLWIVTVLIVLLFLFFYIYQALKVRRFASRRFILLFFLFFSLFLTIGLFVYFLPNLSKLIVLRYAEAKELNDSSIQNRWIYIVEPLKYAKSLYFMGTGLGFDVLFFNPERFNMLLSRGVTKATYMENGYVYFILKTGILGFGVFIWMMFRGLSTAHFIFRNTRDELSKGISLWLITYLIVIMVASNFDQSFNNFMAAPSIAVHFSLLEHLRQRLKTRIGCLT